jgi:hypothetical protein
VRLVASALFVFSTIGAAPCDAQTPIPSVEELQRELTPGDVVTVVPADGQPVTGRLTRIGDGDLEIRPTRGAQSRGLRDLIVPLGILRQLERRRDPVRNGVAIGAGIGAAVGGAMIVTGLIVDRNEADEWAAPYAAATAAFAGIGALVGWAIDAAKSKPHVRFDALRDPRTIAGVQPRARRGRPQRQTMSPSSIARPSNAPAPAPIIVPSVFDPPGAMMWPSTPPPTPPMIKPVVPSSRRQ